MSFQYVKFSDQLVQQLNILNMCGHACITYTYQIDDVYRICQMDLHFRSCFNLTRVLTRVYHMYTCCVNSQDYHIREKYFPFKCRMTQLELWFNVILIMRNFLIFHMNLPISDSWIQQSVKEINNAKIKNSSFEIWQFFLKIKRPCCALLFTLPIS